MDYVMQQLGALGESIASVVMGRLREFENELHLPMEAHCMMLGKSGSGKTYFLSNLVGAAAATTGDWSYEAESILCIARKLRLTFYELPSSVRAHHHFKSNLTVLVCYCLDVSLERKALLKEMDVMIAALTKLHRDSVCSIVLLSKSTHILVQGQVAVDSSVEMRDFVQAHIPRALLADGLVCVLPMQDLFPTAATNASSFPNLVLALLLTQRMNEVMQSM